MNNDSKSILFLPFLQIPSGHHQVANALIDGMKQLHPEINCEKVDILSYSYGKIEFLVSGVYLKWIAAFPKVYNFIYQNSVYKNVKQNKRYRMYELLFIYFMKRLLKEKQPDLIVCTHALPSYMLNFLKKNKQLNIPVINIYTDYFIHRFWGVEYIDFHFVSSPIMKKFLNEKGIDQERIFITGIPIHSKIKKNKQINEPVVRNRFSVLVSGGNLGVCSLEELIQKIENENSKVQINYYVLCGKNIKLFKKLKEKQCSHLIPLPYIDCKDKMNMLYDQIDAILTKPGGVTISESLFKQKPIFIYSALPGQEQINLQELKDLGLVFHLTKEENIHEQLLTILQNEKQLRKYSIQVANFHQHIYPKEPFQLISDILFKS